MGSARLILSEGSSLTSRTRKCPINPTAIFAAVAVQTGAHHSSHGSTYLEKPNYLCLKPRFPRGDLKTSALELRSLKTERSSVILTSCGQEDEGAPLSRSEVVDLLTVAVNMLNKPENLELLRKRLGRNRQLAYQKPSTVLLQSSDEIQWSTSPAPLGALQDLEETVLGADVSDYGKTISDQVSPTISDQVSPSTSRNEENQAKTIPDTHNMTALVQTHEQSKSIEITESNSGSVETRGDSSLTSIRRLKVLDVHSYVHNALRESALRSWLHSRKIEE